MCKKKWYNDIINLIKLPMTFDDVIHHVTFDNFVSHDWECVITVVCELHGEDDDEFCDYNEIEAQSEFDPSKFTGTWYHIYRLRDSPQKYDSEVNYVDIMPDGKLRSYSTYYQ